MTSLIALIFNMVFVSIGMTRNLNGSTAVRSSIHSGPHMPVPLSGMLHNATRGTASSGSHTAGASVEGPTTPKVFDYKPDGSYQYA